MSEPTENTVLRCQALDKSFQEGKLRVDVLRGVDLAVAPGEQVAVVGRSGAGKSTLLHLLGGLEAPSAGEVWVAGEPLHKLGARARGRLRNRALGFIYQFHHLLPEFTAVQNVAMPLVIRGESVSDAQSAARDVLQRVGLGQRLSHKPGELSGGERQRVAIARALVTRPRCVLADEPTGNLDRQTAEQIFALFREVNREYGTAVVLVTHDMALAEQMDRIVTLDDGAVVSSTVTSAAPA